FVGPHRARMPAKQGRPIQQPGHILAADAVVRIAEGILSREPYEVPIHEREIESGRVGDKNWPSRQGLEPRQIPRHYISRMLGLGDRSHLACDRRAYSCAAIAKRCVAY